MFDNEEMSLAQQKQQYGIAGTAAQYIPPTRRQRLEQQRQALVAQVQVIEDALAALDSNPELEKFAETLSRAGV